MIFGGKCSTVFRFLQEPPPEKSGKSETGGGSRLYFRGPDIILREIVAGFRKLRRRGAARTTPIHGVGNGRRQ